MSQSSTWVPINRWFHHITQALFQPVDIASIVLYRIGFGLILASGFYKYFDKGWIHNFYIKPPLLLKYAGFEWVHPLPHPLIEMFFFGLLILSLCIAAGFFYRIATILMFIGFWYLFLLDTTRYLNHYYFVFLLNFINCFIPAHRSFSIDAWLNPSLRSHTIPRWALVWIIFQVSVVYFFGGVAKLNEDWLLRGEPLRHWLLDSVEFPFIGRYFIEPWAAYVFAWGGCLLDLCIVPALLWKPTRLPAFIAGTLFHLTNNFLFNIGIFPWVMMLLNSMFFTPHWPRKALFSLGRYLPLPHFIEKENHPPQTARYPSPFSPLSNRQLWGVLGLELYALIQILFPLRHFWITENSMWTDQGHMFSWHMKLRDKVGDCIFLSISPQGTPTPISIHKVLPKKTMGQACEKPEMALQLVQLLAQLEIKKGNSNPDIRILSRVSLNGRPPQPMYDPHQNLALVHYNHWGSNPWVLPLQTLTAKDKEAIEAQYARRIESIKTAHPDIFHSNP